ncbi:hypothetical protein Dsin_033118 [Dipteronia sinensis]|uniref:Uncharacterized protein n=1 Tax=Dipteronia sinensis TaxID=43782 RepID=A0AAE0DMM6_9ROSI|nr:hypothetical protein Dsin_033118 [Dipteronia sinensis]
MIVAMFERQPGEEVLSKAVWYSLRNLQNWEIYYVYNGFNLILWKPKPCDQHAQDYQIAEIFSLKFFTSRIIGSILILCHTTIYKKFNWQAKDCTICYNTIVSITTDITCFSQNTCNLVKLNTEVALLASSK